MKHDMPGMHDMLAPLTWARALTTWRFAPITAVLVALALGLYLAGVLAARRNGRAWPVARTAAFVAGLAVIVAAVMGSPAVYGDGGLFWVHMIQHLMLIMVVPWLLCLGHPLSLLRAATRGRARDRVERIRLSKAAAFATSPITGLVVYAGVLFGVHLSGFMNAMMGSPALMALEHVLYVGGGYLYFSQLLTRDSPPRELSYPLRLFALFMGMSADTIVGVVLLQATEPPFPAYARMHPSWGPGPLADIHGGGAAMWIGGDGLMFVMTIIVMLRWLSDRSPEAAKAGRFFESVRQATLAATGDEAAPGTGEADRARLRASADVDDDDAALQAYNALLARLNGPGANGPADRPRTG
ncbi:cytochrome c oxidase assembly protein [Actinoallomurus soli]|uniref:cytochrome c oxidase assembly protein n=1 Tax=Actinoallomurus soli TaxID=2952535 RepID=UPI0020920C14|nr:cytochrome c oxidase assembly protein [Actinoallomurus soli]MCO5968380.1 cytochrome c oxidase assembly protein [Actinoallomurus soli]